MRALRRTFAVTAAAALLQMIAGSALGGTAVLCITSDGHITVEAAVPGTSRCSEAAAACELGGAEHGCRDLPMISLDGAVAVPAHGADALPAALPISLFAAAGAVAAPAVAPAPPQRAAPPGSAALRRLTVLQL